MAARALVAGVLLLLGTASVAQSYYRVVRPDGSVTYTDAPSGPIARIERVRTPGLDHGELNEEGERRLREMEAAAERIAEERAASAEAEAERRERLAQAERELRASEAALAQARQSKKSATPERMRLLEDKVRLARERLREVRAGAE